MEAKLTGIVRTMQGKPYANGLVKLRLEQAFASGDSVYVPGISSGTVMFVTLDSQGRPLNPLVSSELGAPIAVPDTSGQTVRYFIELPYTKEIPVSVTGGQATYDIAGLIDEAGLTPTQYTSLDARVTVLEQGGGGGTGGMSQTTADGRYTQRANNLSDLGSAATARTNLGLGTAATAASTAFAAASHTQAASTITDFVEAVQDRLGQDIVAGTGATISYDDAGTGRVTISFSGGGGTTDPEIVRDVIGAAMNAGTGIQVTVNDAGDAITITAIDATTTGKGVVQLAPDGGTTAGTVPQATDSRLSNARTPSGAAGGDLSGTYPNPTLAATGVTAGTYDTGSNDVSFAVDAKGRMTTITPRAKSGGGGGDIHWVNVADFFDAVRTTWRQAAQAAVDHVQANNAQGLRVIWTGPGVLATATTETTVGSGAAVRVTQGNIEFAFARNCNITALTGSGGIPLVEYFGTVVRGVCTVANTIAVGQKVLTGVSGFSGIAVGQKIVVRSLDNYNSDRTSHVHAWWNEVEAFDTTAGTLTLKYPSKGTHTAAKSIKIDRYNLLDNVGVSGGTFTGKTAIGAAPGTADKQNCFWFENCERVRVRDSEISGFQSSGIELRNVWDFVGENLVGKGANESGLGYWLRGLGVRKATIRTLRTSYNRHGVDFSGYVNESSPGVPTETYYPITEIVDIDDWVDENGWGVAGPTHGGCDKVIMRNCFVINSGGGWCARGPNTTIEDSAVWSTHNTGGQSYVVGLDLCDGFNATNTPNPGDGLGGVNLTLRNVVINVSSPLTQDYSAIRSNGKLRNVLLDTVVLAGYTGDAFDVFGHSVERLTMRDVVLDNSRQLANKHGLNIEAGAGSGAGRRQTKIVIEGNCRLHATGSPIRIVNNDPAVPSDDIYIAQTVELVSDSGAASVAFSGGAGFTNVRGGPVVSHFLRAQTSQASVPTSPVELGGSGTRKIVDLSGRYMVRLATRKNNAANNKAEHRLWAALTTRANDGVGQTSTTQIGSQLEIKGVDAPLDSGWWLISPELRGECVVRIYAVDTSATTATTLNYADLELQVR